MPVISTIADFRQLFDPSLDYCFRELAKIEESARRFQLS